MLQPLQEQIVQAGLVDLDGSYVIQLAIFLVFCLIINVLVVKPLGRLQELRYARMEGARVEAEQMDLRASEASTSYQRQIDEARGAAVALREDPAKAAADAANTKLQAVRAEASKSLEAGRTVLNESAEKSRAELDLEVETLAALIADELLGARGGSA